MTVFFSVNPCLTAKLPKGLIVGQNLFHYFLCPVFSPELLDFYPKIDVILYGRHFIRTLQGHHPATNPVIHVKN